MPYSKYNPNPEGKSVGDCPVRALAKALDRSWEEVYIGLCLQGFLMGDLPNADRVWSTYLRDEGFERHTIPSDKWDFYTIEDFANDHPQGTYVLGCDGHVLCVKDGEWYDSWNSGDIVPIYYWDKIN